MAKRYKQMSHFHHDVVTFYPQEKWHYTEIQHGTGEVKKRFACLYYCNIKLYHIVQYAVIKGHLKV